MDEPKPDEHSTNGDGGVPAPKSDSNRPTAVSPGVGDTAHPTERGRYEQAASVAPEGQSESGPGEHAARTIG